MYDVLAIQREVVSLNAVQSAVYRCSATLGLMIRVDEEMIHVLSTRKIEDDEVDALLRHINDYQLREVVFGRTQKYRDAILGAALIRLTSQQDEL
jgi:His-Xaa-Ser system protein HxsD